MNFYFSQLRLRSAQAFGLDLNLDAEAFFGPGNPASATSDFSDTALLNGIGVSLNSDGTSPVSNLTFSSAAGIAYSQNGIIPEPHRFTLDCRFALFRLYLLEASLGRLD